MSKEITAIKCCVNWNNKNNNISKEIFVIFFALCLHPKVNQTVEI
jgi:hypothetical protein